MSKRRYRQKSGQVMLELLYGKADYITRTDVTTINISKMARGLSMRPVRLIDALQWLEEQRLVTDLDVRRYEASMVTRPPEKNLYEKAKDVMDDFVDPKTIIDWNTTEPMVTAMYMISPVFEDEASIYDQLNDQIIKDIEKQGELRITVPTMASTPIAKKSVLEQLDIIVENGTDEFKTGESSEYEEIKAGLEEAIEIVEKAGEFKTKDKPKWMK